jgi:DNA-directed RNA polymerase I, II, and III subunit RPABC2
MSSKMNETKYEEDEEEEEEDDDDDDETGVLSPSKKILKPSKAGVEDDEDEEDASDVDSLKSSNDSDNEYDDEPQNKQIESKTALPLFPEFEESDGEDESDSDDDNYLQKFDETTKHNIISDFHPEMQSHNYDEVDIMATVVRNANGEIIDPLHRTLPFITKYERARILGERAKQLNSGAKPFIDVEPSVIDGYLIALKEFELKRIPFILKRPLPNGGCEYWRMKDLEIL